MSINVKNLLEKKYWIPLLTVFVLGFILVLFRYDAPVEGQILFLLCQIIFVLIPGMAFVQYICPQKDKLILVMISYLAGICITIGMYFIFYLLKIQDFLTVGMCVLSVASVVLIYKKRQTVISLPSSNKDITSVVILIIALLALILFASIRTSRLPNSEISYSFNYYQDMLWNTGNLTAIEKGFPVEDLHVSGLSFSYHFFTTIFLAVFKNILGISSFLLTFRYLAVLQIIVFVFAMYPLLSLVIKNTWVRILLCGVALSCSNILLEHTLWFAHATTFAFAFSIISIYFFIKYIQNISEKRLFCKDFIMFLMFLAVALGTKSLFAGVVTCACAVVFLVNIKKSPKKMLINGFTTMFVVLFIALTMVYGTHTYNSLSVEFGTPMIGQNPIYFKLAKDVLGDGLNVTILMYPVFLIVTQPVLILSIILLIKNMISKKFKEVLTEYFLLAGICVGIIFATILFQPGYSNTLFFLASLPFAIYAIAYVCFTTQKARKLWSIIAICVIAFSVFQTLNTAHKTYSVMKEYKSVPTVTDSISLYEYEAMEWLKKNTNKNDIIAGDKIYVSALREADAARYYYFTAFSERPFYLAGYYYVNAYNKDYKEIIAEHLDTLTKAYAEDEAAITKLKSQGVDYILSSYSVTPEFLLDSSLGELVFSNNEVYIYKL